MEINYNIFIDKIYEKKNKGLISKILHKIKLRKFKNDIRDGSPSFFMLWQMADFVKLAEIIFFYDNTHSLNSNIGIYSSKEYLTGTNGFKIKTDSCLVVVKLIFEGRRVILDIERSKGHKIKTSLEFSNEQWCNDHTLYDEMLLEQTIKIINERVSSLFDHCYCLM